MLLPLHGVKQLHLSGDTFRCGAGEYLMVHRAVDVGVENIPSESHPYRAWIIGFPWRLIELTRQLVVGGVANSLSATRSPIWQSYFRRRLPTGRRQAASLCLHALRVESAVVESARRCQRRNDRFCCER